MRAGEIQTNIKSPQLTATANSLPTLSKNQALANTTQAEPKNTIPSLILKSATPPSQPPTKPFISNFLNDAPKNSEPDLWRGVAAEVIYEAGHVEVSPQVCPDMGKYIRLVIVITSAPSHESDRMAIRQTWGHFASRKDVAIAFILGLISNNTVNENIEKEQYLYGDIVKGKFIDTYENLTLKTISMLEWVDNHCSNAEFLLKTDDDMFINVSKLLGFIAKHGPEHRVIYGWVAKKWKPIRNKKSKYYISPGQYKPVAFPEFTTGPAYLFPARLSKELYVAALNHTYFKLEDVFLTGVVADSLKIKRVHAPEFINKRILFSSCTVKRGISIHRIKGVEQFDLWRKLHNYAALCRN